MWILYRIEVNMQTAFSSVSHVCCLSQRLQTQERRQSPVSVRAAGSDRIKKAMQLQEMQLQEHALVLFHVISFIEGRQSRSKLPLGLHKQHQAVFDETWLKLWCRYCSGVQTHPPQDEFSHPLFSLSSHPYVHFYCWPQGQQSHCSPNLSQPLALNRRCSQTK